MQQQTGLGEVYDLLKQDKHCWRTIDMVAMEKLTSEDIMMYLSIWLGLSLRARRVLPAVTHTFSERVAA